MYSKIDLIEAKESPRLSEDNTLCWYEGDVFSINWKITLLDDQGNMKDFQPTDHLLFQFYSEDNPNKPVAKFDFTNIITDYVTLNFTSAISKKMPAGTYTYCVKYITYTDEGLVNTITTVGANGIAKVENCH